jgi:hypothetical protein
MAEIIPLPEENEEICVTLGQENISLMQYKKSMLYKRKKMINNLQN